MEKSLVGARIEVLDHGIVELIDYMGDDAAVVQAARVSYAGADKPNMSKDHHLLRYLMRQWHTTPFEMCEIKFVIKCPLFVARQWHRHRTASINEYSARYSKVKDEFYIPELSRIQGQSTENKQGSDGKTSSVAETVQQDLKDGQHLAKSLYNKHIHYDISKELARINIPLANYTEYYWKCNVHNLMHFLRLRMDSHAQYEIRVYADAMFEIFKQWMPITAQAFVDYRLEAVSLSRLEKDATSSLIAQLVSICNRQGNAGVVKKDIAERRAREHGLSGRELKEYLAKLDIT